MKTKLRRITREPIKVTAIMLSGMALLLLLILLILLMLALGNARAEWFALPLVMLILSVAVMIRTLVNARHLQKAEPVMEQLPSAEQLPSVEQRLRHLTRRAERFYHAVHAGAFPSPSWFDNHQFQTAILHASETVHDDADAGAHMYAAERALDVMEADCLRRKLAENRELLAHAQ